MNPQFLASLLDGIFFVGALVAGGIFGLVLLAAIARKR